MADVYTTAQASELVGSSADTIRTWKRRQTDKLLEGTHWFKDENNSLLWTESGIQALIQFQHGAELPQSSDDELLQSSEVQPQSSKLELPEIPLLKRYEPLLNLIADAVAPQLQKRLDNKVLDRVQNLGKKAEPLTATECVTILTQLGLKPANPAELLTGQNIQALPASNQ
jgi:hypothetical protein